MLKKVVSFALVAVLICIYFLSDEAASRFTKYIILMSFVIFALNIIIRKGKS